jgi:hypothetical protein
MQDHKKLQEASVDDLLTELRARETESNESPGAESAASPRPARDTRFQEFDSSTISQTLKGKQKVIYGSDDRIDVFQVSDQAILNDVDSVVALFNAADIRDNGNGTSTLRTRNFGAARNLCEGEAFRNQPIGAFCSGFLVAPNIIATAGHCASENDVTTVRFVFGYRMVDADTPQTTIDNAEIYRGVRIVGRQLTNNGPDWCLIEIDRAVPNHRVVSIRREGKVSEDQALHVIGHPVGLPTKVAGGAAVRSNDPAAFFVANLDTYGGNSGSPVFNSENHQVEGILVRGETDFVSSGSCNVSLVCPSTGCRGEDVTRTTEFQQLVPSE